MVATLAQSFPSPSLNIGILNICGQTGLIESKQERIECFILKHQLDILHLQECHISEDTFSKCAVISSSYNIVNNISSTKYGTASLVKNDLNVENVQFDSNGRVIVFDVCDMTVGNIYLPSGTDNPTRVKGEGMQ